MDATNAVRLVEQFHLLFLAQLSRRVDRWTFVVKGGCNLRFFHRSIRYSEDLDLDVGEIEVVALRDHVRAVFASRPFVQILEARGIRIEHVTEHKQTDTTQRWKLGLRVEGAAVPLPTKIECSRRGLDEGVAFGSVDPSVSRGYQVPPLMLSHYDAAAAFRQKVGAAGGAAGGAERLDAEVAARASANAMAIGFAMFKSQVLAYLPPEEQAHYDSASVWDTVVLEVVEALRTHRP
jgi:hypothetical protein